MKLRLFVAIELSDRVRAFAEQALNRLSHEGITGRYELAEKLHVTVAFLGSTGDERLDAVREALRKCAAAQKPFSIDFDCIGAFPNPQRPHVIWIGSSRRNADFAACTSSAREIFGRLGYAFDHDASPHVTICRPKHLQHKALPKLRGTARLEVPGLTLFQSLPAGPTTRYEAIERAPFKESTDVENL